MTQQFVAGVQRSVVMFLCKWQMFLSSFCNVPVASGRKCAPNQLLALAKVGLSLLQQGSQSLVSGLFCQTQLARGVKVVSDPLLI